VPRYIHLKFRHLHIVLTNLICYVWVYTFPSENGQSTPSNVCTLRKMLTTNYNYSHTNFNLLVTDHVSYFIQKSAMRHQTMQNRLQLAGQPTWSMTNFRLAKAIVFDRQRVINSWQRMWVTW
jgi:hypothetical protein